MICFLFCISQVACKTFIVQYSVSKDEYKRGNNEIIKRWQDGVYSSENVFRKEEFDWKYTYLCRTGKCVVYSYHSIYNGLYYTESLMKLSVTKRNIKSKFHATFSDCWILSYVRTT